VTVEPRAVVCASCGLGIDPSLRSVRRARERGKLPVCTDCRRPGRPPPSELELARARRWWIEQSGLALDEIAEIARAVWNEG